MFGEKLIFSSIFTRVPTLQDMKYLHTPMYILPDIKQIFLKKFHFLNLLVFADIMREQKMSQV